VGGEGSARKTRGKQARREREMRIGWKGACKEDERQATRKKEV
jgi:hypothetical protein